LPDSAVPDVDTPGQEGRAGVPRGHEQAGVIGFAGISSRQVRRSIAVARTIQGTVRQGDLKLRRGQLAPRQLGQANYTYYGGPREWQKYRNCVITITTTQLSPTRLCGVMVHVRNLPRNCRAE
jgi:hypothetical protein